MYQPLRAAASSISPDSAFPSDCMWRVRVRVCVREGSRGQGQGPAHGTTPHGVAPHRPWPDGQLLKAQELLVMRRPVKICDSKSYSGSRAGPGPFRRVAGLQGTQSEDSAIKSTDAFAWHSKPFAPWCHPACPVSAPHYTPLRPKCLSSLAHLPPRFLHPKAP